MPTDGDGPTLTVYSRSYCHLCDDMIAGLRALQARFHFRLEVLDVDAEAALESRYGEDVPVLAHGARELCRHRLDSALVSDYLAQIG
ncbi:MAG: glutaredoxin family protein [Rhodoplanes sp.]